MDDALAAAHADHGATFTSVGGERTVADYGRPAVAHRAVRNGVGVVQHPRDVIEVAGTERRAALDAVGLAVPVHEGTGAYGAAAAEGRVVATAHAFAADERTLLVTPPGVGSTICDRVSGADGTTASVRDDVVVFGVHGPHATEKVASVTPGSAPSERLTFDRLTIVDHPATVIRTDAPGGEPGYAVVVDRGAALATFDALLVHGLNATPFGERTWDTLTLEAGTPRFHPDLAGRDASLVAHHAADATPDGAVEGPRFAGVVAGDSLPAGASVDGEGVRGTVTRSARGPSVDRELALVAVEGLPTATGTPEPGGGSADREARSGSPSTGPPEDGCLGRVTVDGTAADLVTLPFLASGERSGRCPPFAGAD